MNEMVASTCEEKWQRLLEAEFKFYAARMELFSTCREQLVELVRAGLNVPSQRVTALGVAQLLTIEERQLLLVDLLALASYCHGLTVTARDIVLSLPQQWLIDNIEESAEPLLQYDDHEEYRGLFEVYVRLDRKLTEKLAERAMNHTDPDIQEAGADFFNILREMES